MAILALFIHPHVNPKPYAVLKSQFIVTNSIWKMDIFTYIYIYLHIYLHLTETG